MPYRFRLRIAAKGEGKFRFNASETPVALSDGCILCLVARNAESLEKATAFHFEAGGFLDEANARLAGERLRLRLRILNAMLSLGINVPVTDSVSASVSSAIKDQVRESHDAVVVDSVWGLATFPDDDRHFEYVVGGKVDVQPSDPAYVLKALEVLWDVDVRLDQRSEDALHILGLATLESSDKAAFLANYLALEPLIPREKRGKVAFALIERFQRQVKKASLRKRAPLGKKEATSLTGALAGLSEESFSGALMRFADRLATPKELRGSPVRKFLSACIGARNQIAHNAEIDPSISLAELSAGLRELALGLIWTYNRIPDVSVAIPPSSVSVPHGGLTVRVL